LTFEDWFRQERNTSQEGSIVLKAMVRDFPLIGNWIAWKVERWNKVRTREDPWIGCKGNFRISIDFIRHVHLMGIYNVEEIIK
jgi:hypothetical protein